MIAALHVLEVHGVKLFCKQPAACYMSVASAERNNVINNWKTLECSECHCSLLHNHLERLLVDVYYNSITEEEVVHVGSVSSAWKRPRLIMCPRPTVLGTPAILYSAPSIGRRAGEWEFFK